MKAQSVNIQILDQTGDFVSVKLPFLDVPVKMNNEFLEKRIQNGYFKVQNEVPNNGFTSWII